MRIKRYVEDSTEAEIGRDVKNIMQGRPVGNNENNESEGRTEGQPPENTATELSPKEKKRIEKQRRKEQSRRDMPYVFISYSFVFIFLCLIIYLVYFNLYRRDEIQNSSYNRRQDTQAEYIVRGNILSQDGQELAVTSVYEGTEAREYPLGRVFAHVVGYFSNGKSGIESFANYDLLTSHYSVIDRILNEFEGRKNPGDHVVTTLSAKLQQTCYNVLGDYQGAVMVMDPHTGAILAMVSKPDFDPNTIKEEWNDIISDEGNSQLVNRVTQGLYPPGSTFKIVTALSHYQEYGSLDGFDFNCQGELTVENHTVHCFNGIIHGQENFSQAFANSCNCAFSSIGLNLGADRLGTTAETLLFGKKLPCDLIYNRSRFNLTAKDGSAAMMQTAFGQGNTLVTPYHMALIVSAIANDGVLMQPQLISKIITADGMTVRENKSSEFRRIMTVNESETLQHLMEGVVSFGTAADLSGLSYSVAGKTGSAEYYTSDGQIATHSWFVGYSNTEDPDIVVVVLAENGGAGSQTAVPMAHEIFDAYYYE